MDVYHDETTVEDMRDLLDASRDAQIRHPILDRIADAETLLGYMDGERGASLTIAYDGAHPEEGEDYRDPANFSATVDIPTGHALNPLSRLRVSVEEPEPYHEEAVEGLYDRIVEDERSGMRHRVRARIGRLVPGLEYPDPVRAAENLQRFTEYVNDL